MGNYGIKVSQAGYTVTSATPSQLVFSSKYQTLKVEQQGSGSITHSGGRLATISHSLGYVPMFLVHTQLEEFFGSYFGDYTDYFIAPYGITGIGGICHEEDKQVIAWADSTNLYIKLESNFGWLAYDPDADSNNYAYDQAGVGYSTGAAYFGSDGAGGALLGAVRLPSVPIAKDESLYAAYLEFYFNTRVGSDSIYFRTYGIDEDDTDAFNVGTQAFARSQTTAYDEANTDNGQGETFGIDVSDEVAEITSRSGWSSGNAMGFTIREYGSTASNNYAADAPGSCFITCCPTYLRFLRSDTLASYKYTIYKNELDP